MLVDANLLLFAVDRASPFHAAASGWWNDQLNGPRRVGIQWQSLGAFLRITTNPRASRQPLASAQAWEAVEGWLACEVVWTPEPGPRFAGIPGELVVGGGLSANLISDAQLAALAIEHGLTVQSADSDFAAFEGLRWENPLASG